MGFSPGEFTSNGSLFHWEGKGNGDIILWDETESRALLQLTTKEARTMKDQLYLLIDMAEHNEL